MSFSPLFSLTFTLFSSPANSSKTSEKKIFTKCPKITGSLTFIIEAFKCTLKSKFLAFASAICSFIKVSSLLALIKLASIISPFSTAKFSFSTRFSPLFEINSTRKFSSVSKLIERSEE